MRLQAASGPFAQYREDQQVGPATNPLTRYPANCRLLSMIRFFITGIIVSALVAMAGCKHQLPSSADSPAAVLASDATCSELDPPAQQTPESKEPDPKVQLERIQNLERRIASAAVQD